MNPDIERMAKEAGQGENSAPGLRPWDLEQLGIDPYQHRPEQGQMPKGEA